MKQASGTVQIGEAPDAPHIPLKISPEGTTLEVALGKDMKFPFTLTLVMRFPGSPQNEKPEVFTFPFSHFSGNSHPQAHGAAE